VDVFLVGDSAFGVPFFRALNNGFLCGSHLAFTLAKSVDATKKNNLTVVGNFLQWASRGTQVGSFMMDKLQLGLSQIGHKVRSLNMKSNGCVSRGFFDFCLFFRSGFLRN
jgi:hypothetical protein